MVFWEIKYHLKHSVSDREQKTGPGKTEAPSPECASLPNGKAWVVGQGFK